MANTASGLLDAMCDSIPVLCISGQVATGAIGTDAFQECDAIGISRPVTKWNAQIRRTEDVAGVVSKAYRLTTSGRPGPVLLDFSKDMQIGLVPEPAVTESPEAAAGIETAKIGRAPSELKSLMRHTCAVFCLKKKIT